MFGTWLLERGRARAFGAARTARAACGRVVHESDRASLLIGTHSEPRTLQARWTRGRSRPALQGTRAAASPPVHHQVRSWVPRRTRSSTPAGTRTMIRVGVRATLRGCGRNRSRGRSWGSPRAPTLLHASTGTSGSRSAAQSAARSYLAFEQGLADRRREAAKTTGAHAHGRSLGGILIPRLCSPVSSPSGSTTDRGAHTIGRGRRLGRAVARQMQRPAGAEREPAALLRRKPSPGAPPPAFLGPRGSSLCRIRAGRVIGSIA